MRPLKDSLPPASDKVLYVFYDSETTQNTEYTDEAKLHVPNLVCVQQFCSKCEVVEDGDCVQCGRRKHSLLQYPLGDLHSYLTEPRPWANTIVAIAHNAKSFDIHFILNRAILLKWKPELIMNGLKIMSMKMENLVFLVSVSFLPCSLRMLPEAYCLTASKSWYPLYFNTEEIPDVTYYGVNEIGEEEGQEFLAWYESQKSGHFDNRRVLEKYFQDDVTFLRQACRVFRRQFMHTGNIDVFLESVKISSACNKVFRKRFQQPYTIGLIPIGGYSCNNNYSKKALMWLLHMEETHGVNIMHCRNCLEYMYPNCPASV